jgi:hypothetical protein
MHLFGGMQLDAQRLHVFLTAGEHLSKHTRFKIEQNTEMAPSKRCVSAEYC